MIDNSNKFRNFKESIPKSKGSLPIPPYVNVKHVVMNWFEHRFSTLKLQKPVIILGDYPSQTMLSDLPNPEKDGRMDTNNLRGVSVVLLDGSVKRKGIGEVLRTEEVPTDPTAPQALTYGWHERLQLEVSYWSVSSRDRDYGGDLVRTFMYEAFRAGWFMSNGLIEMYLHNYYDTSDDRHRTLNKVLSYSVSTFEFTREFFGTLDTTAARGPVIEDVEVGGDMEVPDGGNFTPMQPTYHDKVFLPAAGNGVLASFDRYSEGGVIVLPSGASVGLDQYRMSAKSSGQSLGICTTNTIP